MGPEFIHFPEFASGRPLTALSGIALGGSRDRWCLGLTFQPRTTEETKIK